MLCMPQSSVAGEVGVPLVEAVDDFLQDVKARTRRATAEHYDLAVRKTLLPWCKANKVSTVADLDQKRITAWVAWMRTEHKTPNGKPLSDASVHSYASHVNTFLKWCADEYKTTAGHAKTPKVRRAVVDVLSRQEMDRIERATLNERDALFVRVLADTGVRISEALALREGDIIAQDSKHHFLMVDGKTGSRLVPIGPKLYRRLREFIRDGRPRQYTGDHIFVSNTRRHGEYGVPTRWSMGDVIREAALDAGITKRVHPHLFRHSAITHELRQGMSPLLVAQVAGHSSLEMIRSTYAHLSVMDAHSAMMDALGDG